MDESILAAILANTFSLVEARRRVGLAQTFFEHENFAAAGDKRGADRFREFYRHSSEASADVEAVAAWGEDFFTAFGAGNFYEQLRELKTAIERLPTATVYVPIAFSEDTIARLGAWCRKNLHPNLLIDLRVDPQTIGGCSIVYGNTYQDLSFAHFAAKARPDITKLVHSYGV